MKMSYFPGGNPDDLGTSSWGGGGGGWFISLVRCYTKNRCTGARIAACTAKGFEQENIGSIMFRVSRQSCNSHKVVRKKTVTMSVHLLAQYQIKCQQRKPIKKSYWTSAIQSISIPEVTNNTSSNL